MSEHKHAAVFLAAARGEADEYEAQYRTLERHKWWSASDILNDLYECPDGWTSRRKQKTHTVNGFTVPEPLREIPQVGSMYSVEYPSNTSFFETFRWNTDSSDSRSIERGIAHATKEGAIANCKARLGIDPAKDES
jgi:hypothetical protein